MKNFLMAFIAVIGITFQLNAQITDNNWITNVPTTKCFCCDNKYFNLPNLPPITGPTSINCNATASYSTIACPGATITWAISPAKPFLGQGTSTITLNPAHTPGTYTISVTIRCGEKTVKNQLVITIKELPNCIPNFMITLEEKPNGLYQVSTTPTTTSGVIHFWLLHEVANCPNGAVTATSSNWNLYITATGSLSTSNAAITGGATGYGYQYGGLGKGKCYRLTHYVYCCGQWKSQTKCFCLTSTLRARMSDVELEPTVTTKDVQFNELPAELKQHVKEKRMNDE
jgi:hypothetical protein